LPFFRFRTETRQIKGRILGGQSAAQKAKSQGEGKFCIHALVGNVEAKIGFD
jgi:hypothetical protein